jgi:hypothetical protein
MISHHTPNSDIVFDDYEVQIIGDNDNIWAEGEVTAIQQFQPTPRYIFKGKLKVVGQNFPTFSQTPTKCKFVNENTTMEVILLNIQFSKEPQVTFILSKPPLTIKTSDQLKEVKFNLINFSKEARDQEFEFSDWKVKLTQISSKDEYDEINKNGGYLVTHKGSLIKKNDAIFDIESAEAALEYLFNLFSFCKATSTPAYLVEGFDQNQDVVWKEIGDSKISNWKKYLNWFSDAQIQINDFASGFYSFCQEESYKNFITEIIYWYVNINSATGEQAVISIHTALELISWIFLTGDTKVLSTDGFHKLQSGDCLALVLGYKNIPTDISPKLSHLQALANSENLNGPLLFSRVRNKIVHPPSKRRDEFTTGRVIFEAKSLGSWYLELFLLSKSDFQGKYTSILNYDGWTGETEELPWASNA